MTRHGLPAAMTLGGMSRVTTLPAPMIELSPIVTPLRTIDRVPMKTFRPIFTSAEAACPRPSRRSPGSIGICDEHIAADEGVIAYRDALECRYRDG